jgi:hypothetical protein
MNIKKLRLLVGLVVCIAIVVGFAAPLAWSQAVPAQRQEQVVQKKSATERKALSAEWTSILKEHPRFARVFLAQQYILMESRERNVREGICLLMANRLPVLFEGHWVDPCAKTVVDRKPTGVLGCLIEGRGDPADCFTSDEEVEWFDDPLGLYPIPPKLPDRPPIPKPK